MKFRKMNCGVTNSMEVSPADLSSQNNYKGVRSLTSHFTLSNHSDQCPVEPTISFGAALRDRAYWLVGLLLMQSFSGIILSRNEALLADHPVIIFFLTMLVGAGGNAGNQASVRGTFRQRRPSLVTNNPHHAHYRVRNP